MHIPDGFLDPKISTGLMGAAAAVLGFSFGKVKAAVTAMAPQRALALAGQATGNLTESSRRVLTRLGENQIYRMGMIASFIFIAQLFDFPVNQGTSGHLMGGVLAAVLVGPFGGTLAMAAVLVIQSLFLSDGGLLALGANIINMAFFGSLVSYYLFISLKKVMPESPSLAAAAWASVVMSALACAVEIGFSGAAALGTIVPAMFTSHAIIGLAEAALTLPLVALFRKILPGQG